MLEEWPVHGFLVTYPGGAVLVDAGVGGPQQVLADHRIVNRSVADALDEHGMTPGDIGGVINTHPAFRPLRAARRVQVRRFLCPVSRAGAGPPGIAPAGRLVRLHGCIELLDGDAEILLGLSVVTTQGHAVGHQSVVVSTDHGAEVLIGHAAYKRRQYLEPDDGDLPPGQASDPAAWRESAGRVHALRPDRVHFCHDTEVIHS
jgi:N-acyl homoserine lactone hydrolase